MRSSCSGEKRIMLPDEGVHATQASPAQMNCGDDANTGRGCSLHVANWLRPQSCPPNGAQLQALFFNSRKRAKTCQSGAYCSPSRARMADELARKNGLVANSAASVVGSVGLP